MPERKRMLITGASGLLGNKIVMTGKHEYVVIPMDVAEPLHPKAIKSDLTNQSAVTNLFVNHKPDLVIHTASETNVDKCETQKEQAWKVNVEGTRNLALLCREFSAKLVYISTDYVFDGRKGWYDEEYCPNPISNYGITKFEGERIVAKICQNYAILRTSVLYGNHPYKQDFATWVTSKLKQCQEIRVVEDHINTPTLADNLAEMALEVVEKDLQGLYHASGSERISRFDFAKRIAENFNLDSSLVKPIKMDELKAWIARRPRDSSLNTEKIRKQLKAKPLNIAEGLSKLKAEMETRKA